MSRPQLPITADVKAIRAARIKAGLSLRAVASEVGWTNGGHLSQFELGRLALSAWNRDRILEAIARLVAARDKEAPG